MNNSSKLWPWVALAATLAGLAWWLWEGVQAPGGDPAPNALPSLVRTEAASALFDGGTQPDKTTLERTAVAAPIPGGDGARLTLTVHDPLGLLEHPHELQIRAGTQVFTTDWLREGATLRTRLRAGAAPPEAVAFALLPLFPLDHFLCEAEVRPDGENFTATLELADRAALVEIAALGPAEALQRCSLKAKFLPFGGREGTLDLTEDARAPLLVIAPVPCSIIVELQDSLTGGWHQEFLPMFEAGRFRREIQLPTGSLRVIAPSLPAARQKDRTHTLALQPSLRSGGKFFERLVPCEPGEEALLTLLQPGEYELLWRDSRSSSNVYANLPVTIGYGETVLRLEPPVTDRSLTVRFEPGASTFLNLYRSGSSFGPVQSRHAAPSDSEARFLNLDAGEWIVTARRNTRAAYGHADTRGAREAEVTLGEWQTLTDVSIELAPSPEIGEFYVQIHEPSGFTWQRFIDSEHGWTWSYATHPGLLRIEAVHQYGLVAEALVAVPSPSAQPVTLLAPLNFRAP